VKVSQGLTLDTGALIALDQPSKATLMQQRIDATRARGRSICIPVEVVAQAWRGPRQARLARLLKAADVEVVHMTATAARAVGMLCAESGHDDVVDAHVVLCARARGHTIVTSDPNDISRIDPTVSQLRI
jgi:predicted nucleic acid-binding protein